MNRESFYLALGNIDDALIQEACHARGRSRHRGRFLRFAGIAACLCFVCVSAFWGMTRDVIYFNAASAPLTSKVLVPADENTAVRTLDDAALFDYYGLEPFPTQLFGLYRLEQPYLIYQKGDRILYDTNVIRYRSEDGTQTLSVMLAKQSTQTAVLPESAKQSRLDGVSWTLAVSEDSPIPVYWAERSGRDLDFRVIASGVEESVFIDILRELVSF